ncbi:hypothetical protein [Nostoc sp. UHCC 0251]|nr:hypothetical protein [Nostoc sp. UHCC 0251]MEA5625022.1 hypothetical protein [Nostoc sp. UHCC 0251]
MTVRFKNDQLPLEQAVRAHELLESSAGSGQLLLTCSSGNN